jgi:hypothetical protein
MAVLPVTSRPRKYASRGRRGQSRPALSDNEWWALANTTALSNPLAGLVEVPVRGSVLAFEEWS